VGPPQDLPPQDIPPQDIPSQDIPPQNIPPQEKGPREYPIQNIVPQVHPPPQFSSHIGKVLADALKRSPSMEKTCTPKRAQTTLNASRIKEVVVSVPTHPQNQETHQVEIHRNIRKDIGGDQKVLLATPLKPPKPIRRILEEGRLSPSMAHNKALSSQRQSEAQITDITHCTEDVEGRKLR
jgi:predicted AlkP superfamily phosphohydrolase/phosphomutase